MLSTLLPVETTHTRVLRILRVTHKVTYSSGHNVCLALLSSKMAVMIDQKGKVVTVGEKEREEHKTDYITEEKHMAIKTAT